MPFRFPSLLMLIISLLLSGCSRTKQLARAPVTDVPSVDYQGPAPEVENQTTSAPIMVDRLPEPTSTAAEAPPNLAPPAQRTPASRQPRIAVESRKEVKPVSPPPAETRPVAQVPPIQLLPQFSESDKTALYKKINDQLESARSVLRSIDESQLTEQEKPNLAAVVDFIKKSEDALKHGQFYQGLVLAQKANTLAASLARNP